MVNTVMDDGDVNSLEQLVGNRQLFCDNCPLRMFYYDDNIPPSMILFGPPGVGKTTYAKLLAKKHNLNFEFLDATNCPTDLLRKTLSKGTPQKPILIVIDEIHRLDKRQQDLLLLPLEKGCVVLVGTSTYNPYYKLSKALRSRLFVYEFKRLSEDDLIKLAIQKGYRLEDAVLKKLALLGSGDARRFQKMIDIAERFNLSSDDIDRFFNIDVGYENESQRYDIVSAFIKSMRASDPDAAVYWLARMIEAGEDIEFIARRMVIFAAEDVGLADKNALLIAQAALEAVSEIGMPEAKIILSYCCIYLALAKKSNSTYAAINKAISDIKNGNIMEVPEYLKVKGRRLYKNPHYTHTNQPCLPKKVKYFTKKENDLI
ncbi:AAA family ATPase [Hippea jasoniae]|uniref:AAA family ATPase n=1 Tax=Hippea jasoniae TaxID=944479 RepID=UPI00068A4EDE|nr:AAA family ATPase [Hippea jasoniae]